MIVQVELCAHRSERSGFEKIVKLFGVTRDPALYFGSITLTGMRVLPNMTQHQQRLYCAFALLEECDLRAFFRAIRAERNGMAEVELVNRELDRGISLMDIFGPLGPFAGHMNENWLELSVIKLISGRWAITYGFHGEGGCGGSWSMNISAEGEVFDIECGVRWRSNDQELHS